MLFKPQDIIIRILSSLNSCLCALRYGLIEIAISSQNRPISGDRSIQLVQNSTIIGIGTLPKELLGLLLPGSELVRLRCIQLAACIKFYDIIDKFK